jgi:hypothetical protein
MIEIINELKINTFLGTFIPKFLLSGSIIYFMYIVYIFLRCMRKQEKLSESLTVKEKQYFYIAITYIFTYILI